MGMEAVFRLEECPHRACLGFTGYEGMSHSRKNTSQIQFGCAQSSIYLLTNIVPKNTKAHIWIIKKTLSSVQYCIVCLAICGPLCDDIAGSQLAGEAFLHPRSFK